MRAEQAPGGHWLRSKRVLEIGTHTVHGALHRPCGWARSPCLTGRSPAHPAWRGLALPPLPCLQLAGLRENGGLVTCKTGAVFWGSHTEYCGQRWRTEKKKREKERKSPQLASATGRCRPEAPATPHSPARPHPAPLGPSAWRMGAGYQVLGGSATQWHTRQRPGLPGRGLGPTRGGGRGSKQVNLRVTV